MAARIRKAFSTQYEKIIGRRIATIRIARGMSQAALGTAIGISAQQIHNYENGRGMLGSARLQAIAYVLEVSPLVFIAEEGDFLDIAGVEEQSLLNPQSLELLRSYASIEDEKLQSDIISFIKAVLPLQSR